MKLNFWQVWMFLLPLIEVSDPNIMKRLLLSAGGLVSGKKSKVKQQIHHLEENDSWSGKRRVEPKTVKHRRKKNLSKVSEEREEQLAALKVG